MLSDKGYFKSSFLGLSSGTHSEYGRDVFVEKHFEKNASLVI